MDVADENSLSSLLSVFFFSLQQSVNSVKGKVNGNKIQCTFLATVPSTTTRTSNLAIGITTGSYNASKLTYIYTLSTVNLTHCDGHQRRLRDNIFPIGENFQVQIIWEPQPLK